MWDNTKLESTIKKHEIPFDLPSNWTWYKWGDLIEEYQQGLIRSNRDLKETGVPYLKMNNLDNNGNYSINKLAYTEVSSEEFKKYKLLPHDFLINVRNSKELVGKTCVIGKIDFDMVFNHMLVRITHHNSVSNIFINALLKTPIMRKFIDRCKKGTTTVIALYQKDLYDIPIPLPDWKTQHDISDLIEKISDKVELNNQLNSELETIIQTLYNYWFVQFDFPDEGGNPYKTSGGTMEYNEVLKREIPKGWEVSGFSSYIENFKGGDWGKESSSGNYIQEVVCIRGADIPNISDQSIISAPTRYILNKNDDKLLNEFEFVIEISGGSPTQATGRIGYIIKSLIERIGKSLICSNFCKAITLKENSFFYNFYLEWQRAYSAGVQFNYEGKTTGLKNFMFERFIDDYKIVIPEIKIAQMFFEIVNPQFELMQKNAKQNQELIQLRDFLLPLLMNGQVKVN